ncbi:hypothetical protein [Pseudomonas donghuensis]|uniref:hypothetical protein n=1 Tax=Pseudomonas donghuensis TaxID=1163398 RepID=UPI001FD22D0B|nr:hypothetical protein [Pseudomonas donghuensis]MCP6691149.1 hypothetical protein [Pseudomonas donghuensis]MCP6696064.1 hypothetical protein [Pseudomonas donghuensis]UVL27055.1 hypothetical protein LOY30_11825 [Pseudomonas donghuensis]UVL32042.1 hypothetical protein LOY32_11500 [Pseudomonas donghuensis]
MLRSFFSDVAVLQVMIPTPPWNGSNMQKTSPRPRLLRATLLALAALSSASISGCLTSALYKPRASDEVYTEQVGQLYVTADQKSLVVLGKKYHYVILVEPELLQAIRSGLHAKMQAEFLPVHVGMFKTLDGEFVLKIPGLGQLDPHELNEAQALGFVASAQQDALLHRYRIRGSRFESAKDITGFQGNTLNSTYTLQVSAYREKSKVTQVLLTPVTVTADGVLMILAAPLLPVAFMVAQPFRVK